MPKYLLLLLLFPLVLFATIKNHANEPQIYTRFQIVEPTQNATIRDNNGIVHVTLAVNPALQPTDTIVLLLDGKPIAKPQSSLDFTLTNINRGTHQLLAEIINSSGLVIKQTPAVTFYLHRAHNHFERSVQHIKRVMILNA